ncbi:hypothetical protein EVA_19256 [gut metagenome]|uniref:Uncharacterized protein n=1 Tax=gut metagenome TaxID=749906 RepID=J9FSU9_9ZZZZ
MALQPHSIMTITMVFSRTFTLERRSIRRIMSVDASR